MSGRRLLPLLALGGCLSSPPSTVDGDGGVPDDGGGGGGIACETAEDCPAQLREPLCHCGSCAVRDPDCEPSPLRWLREDGTDGLCAPTPADLALGYESTCVRWNDGRVSCWGGDCLGEIGDGGEGDCADSPQYSAVPRLVRETQDGPPLGDVVALSAGFHQVCALKIDGTVWCWGSNDHGKLGVGSRDTRSTTPVQVMTDTGDKLSGMMALATGSEHACALDTMGFAYCWGHNGYKQLGVGAIPDRDTAARAGIGRDFTRIAAGGYHSCVARVDKDGEHLYCWGRGSFGQLGFGGTLEGSEGAQLVKYEQDLGVSLVPTVFGLGENFTCSATEGPGAWCWGSNVGHALGDQPAPTTEDGTDALAARRMMPDPANPPGKIVAGTSFACMRLEDRTLTCWGINGVGQLGVGEATALPLGVTEVPVDTEDLEAGDDHVCAITSDRTVVCWGGNAQGQLGNGGTEPSTDATEVIDLCQ